MSDRDRAATILIVEDEVEFRLLLRVVLDRTTHCRVVAEASDGIEAVSAAQEHRPDVILLDVHMPKGDGLSVVPDLDRVSPKSTVIVVSSDPDTEVVANEMGVCWVDKARLLRDLPAVLDQLAFAV